MNFFFSQLKVIILIFNFISGIFSNRTFRISASSYTYNETDTRLANYGISWKIFTRFFTFDSFLYQILFTSSISRTFTVRMQNKVWHISILYTHIYIYIYIHKRFPFIIRTAPHGQSNFSKRFPILISILLRHRPWFPMNRRLVKMRDHSNFYFIYFFIYPLVYRKVISNDISNDEFRAPCGEKVYKDIDSNLSDSRLDKAREFAIEEKKNRYRYFDFPFFSSFATRLLPTVFLPFLISFLISHYPRQSLRRPISPPQLISW